MALHAWLDRKATVTDSARAEFERDGWRVFRQAIEADEIQWMRSCYRGAIKEYAEIPPPNNHPEWEPALSLLVYDAWHSNPLLQPIALSAHLAGMAASLLGVPRVRLYSEQILLKGPGRAASQWHQDGNELPVHPESLVTCWIPLVRVTPEMGTPSFASRSHLEGLTKFDHDVLEDQHLFFERLIHERGFEVVRSLSYEVGDISFHHGLTLHSAGANISEVARESIALVYVADGTRVLPPRTPGQKAELMQVLRGLIPGDPVGGVLHPIVFDRDA